jgi:hypothetical protein
LSCFDRWVPISDVVSLGETPGNHRRQLGCPSADLRTKPRRRFGFSKSSRADFATPEGVSEPIGFRHANGCVETPYTGCASSSLDSRHEALRCRARGTVRSTRTAACSDRLLQIQIWFSKMGTRTLRDYRHCPESSLAGGASTESPRRTCFGGFLCPVRFTASVREPYLWRTVTTVVRYPEEAVRCRHRVFFVMPW